MGHEIRIYTSYVSSENIKKCVDLNLLPIFIMRKIYNSQIIGKYSDTALHIPELAPSNELYHAYKNSEITQKDYLVSYEEELHEVDLEKLISRFELLSRLSNSSGIVLMTYGKPETEGTYRSVTADYLNKSGLLDNLVYEIG